MDKAINSFGVLLCSAMLFFSINSYAGSAGGVGTSSVKFGTPDNKGMTCLGKGICMLTSIGSSSTELPVTFTYVPQLDGDDFYTVSFQFNISKMEQIDSTYLYTYFLYPNTSRARLDYRFDSKYTFDDKELCRDLGVNPGDITINPADDSTIETLFNSDVRVTYRIMVSTK